MTISVAASPHLYQTKFWCLWHLSYMFVCHSRIYGSLLLWIFFHHVIPWIPPGWWIFDKFVSSELQQLLFCLQNRSCCCILVKEGHKLSDFCKKARDLLHCYWFFSAELKNEWWRVSWTKGQDPLFTGWLTFQPSPMVMNCGYWQKEWDQWMRMRMR